MSELTTPLEQNRQTALANVTPMTSLQTALETCLNAISPTVQNQFQGATSNAADVGETLGLSGTEIKRLPKWSDANANQAANIMIELANNPQNAPIFEAAGITQNELQTLSQNVQRMSNAVVVAQQIASTVKDARFVSNAALRVEFNRLYNTAKGAADNGSAAGERVYNSLRVMYPHSWGRKNKPFQETYAGRNPRVAKALEELRNAGFNCLTMEHEDGETHEIILKEEVKG
jgi:hypothetical protein